MEDARAGNDPAMGYDRLMRFAEEVGAQAIGTVTGAGLLYLFAGWFGMVQPPPGRIVLAVLLAALIPALSVLLLRRRLARRPDRIGGILDAE